MAANETTPPATTPAAEPCPIIVDLGAKSKKKVKRLRRGKGALLEAVHEAIAELRDCGRISGTAQPIIVVVREKPESWSII